MLHNDRYVRYEVFRKDDCMSINVYIKKIFLVKSLSISVLTVVTNSFLGPCLAWTSEQQILDHKGQLENHYD